MSHLSVSGPARGLLRLAEGLDWVNRAVGAAVAWLALAMVLVTFAVVVLRYGFDVGSIALQESITYLFATLFMLGVAYTLQQDGHVRAWVDLLGSLLLLAPVCGFLFIASWDYVADAWSIREGSREAGGLAGVWLLKTLLLAMPVLMLLQGLVWVLRNGLCIAGVEAALEKVESDPANPPPVGQPARPSEGDNGDEPDARRESSARG
ncbi:MAG: TRAP transporter small permease subunit [Halochromatium sp.]